jgi:RNA polymerase sigma factor (sigma-70 family)
MDDTESSADEEDLERLVARARKGDREALESVVRAIQPDVYRIALRFLGHPQDAEDASQEILIRVITGLGGFRGDSRFRTWTYRIACNALITFRKKGRMEHGMSLEEFGDDLARGLSDEALAVDADVDRALLLEEVKIGCTLALLMCLDRNHRLAYVLGEIMEMDHNEAAVILAIAPGAFRKRLSRARARITNFMMSRCGLVNPENACRCRRRVDAAIKLGRVDPTNLLYATSLEQARRFPEVLVTIRKLEGAQRAVALYRSHPEACLSDELRGWLSSLGE